LLLHILEKFLIQSENILLISTGYYAGLVELINPNFFILKLHE